MKKIRKVIRKVLLEYNNQYDKLAKMLLSNDLESINQAIEIGEPLGLFKLEDTFDRDMLHSVWSSRFGSRGAKQRVFCLDVEPEMHAALVKNNDRYLQPMRMSELEAGYEGGIWIFCEIRWQDAR